MRLIRYINQSMDDDFNTPQLFRNIDTPTIQGAVTAFKENDMHRIKRKRSVAMYHEILSVHVGEDSQFMRKHPDKIKALMQAYMDIRDPECKAMGYCKVHQDKANLHIHFAWHGTEVGSSKTLRMSRDEFNEVRYKTEEWQMKHLPELKQSIVYHDPETGKRLPIKKYEKSRSLTKEYRLKKNLAQKQQITHKEKLQKIVEKAYMRSTIEVDFHAEILKQGLELNYRNGKCNGIRYNNKAYRWDTLHVDELVRALKDKELQRQRKWQLDILKQQKLERSKDLDFDHSI